MGHSTAADGLLVADVFPMLLGIRLSHQDNFATFGYLQNSEVGARGELWKLHVNHLFPPCIFNGCSCHLPPNEVFLASHAIVVTIP